MQLIYIDKSAESGIIVPKKERIFMSTLEIVYDLIDNMSEEQLEALIVSFRGTAKVTENVTLLPIGF